MIIGLRSGNTIVVGSRGDLSMIRHQPLRHIARPVLIVAGIAAYTVFAVLVMLLVFRIAGA